VKPWVRPGVSMLLLSMFNLANATQPLPLADGSAGGFDGAWDPGAGDVRDLGDLGEPPIDGGSIGVVGGSQVKEGKWDDAVGIVFSSAYVGCTGTLIGPKVVLTAGHCVNGLDVSHVIVGSKDWAEDGGEVIEVEGVFEYPNSQFTYDVAVLTLAEPSSYEPRAIALDCVKRDFLEDGAKVQIVGYGATTAAGTGWNTQLNEAEAEVYDEDCDESTINGVYAGCREPGGELAAGGAGQACYGDSGGPLYLKTGNGAYVVGVASRLFAGTNPSQPCQGGAIWVRPDAVIGWIEDQIGNRPITYPVCNEAPEALVDEIVTTMGVAGSVRVQIDDPDGPDDEVTIEVVVEPEHGEVEIDVHDLVYTPDGDFVGDDEFTVLITDGGTSKPRTGTPVSIELDVDVEVGAAPADELEDEENSGVVGGCGCDGGAGGALGGFGALSLLAAFRRRASPSGRG
jgi:hypothetical protein